MKKVLSHIGTLMLLAVFSTVFALPAFAQEYIKTTEIRKSDLYLTPALTTVTATDPALVTNDSAVISEVTLSPAMRQVILESVQAGKLPDKNDVKGLSPEEKAAVVAEIERILKEKADAEEAKPKGGFIQNVFSEYLVQFLALVVSLVGVVLAVSGFSIAASKKKKHISKYMNEIDDAFNSFKWKSKRCEAELYRLHDIIEEKLKEGKLDESSYQLLSNRIEKYLKEVQDVDGIPNHIKNLSKDIDKT